jgi:vacuolar-type H+-ATPase subunit H
MAPAGRFHHANPQLIAQIIIFAAAYDLNQANPALLQCQDASSAKLPIVEGDFSQPFADEPTMDDTLKQLLAAEAAATELVNKAERDGERLVQAALHEARQQDDRFNDRKPEIHAAFLEKADQRANQTVSEMDRRFQERLNQLREAADRNEERALDAAFQTLLGQDETGDA